MKKGNKSTKVQSTTKATKKQLSPNYAICPFFINTMLPAALFSTAYFAFFVPKL
jgi:hypothetical protein